nr:hypothetical protein [Rhodospira trueperi]
MSAVLLATGCQTTSGSQTAQRSSLPSLEVAFTDPTWTGDRLPSGQHCTKFGGNGSTPPLAVSALPAGTSEIVLAFNDLSYPPLARNGGHGKIGFPVPDGADSVMLPAVPGETRDLPGGAYVVARNRASGSYSAPGYLPPCSGGKGNTYNAVVTARDASGTPLAEGRITLGRY